MTLVTVGTLLQVFILYETYWNEILDDIHMWQWIDLHWFIEILVVDATVRREQRTHIV